MAFSSKMPHIAIFPYMAKGHTIPLIHLAYLLHRRHLASVTFFTTPLNAPFIRHSLAGTDATIIELPFPQDVPGLPSGIESTDRLPSISMSLPFYQATKLLRPHFEQALESLQLVSCLISDAFLGWTNESAKELGIPRLAFYGMGNYATVITTILVQDRPHAGITSNEQPFKIPGLPHIELTKADLSPPFDEPDPPASVYEFVNENWKATAESDGMIVNSFYELEAPYFEFWNEELAPKAWCIGPLCLANNKPASDVEKPEWMQWLDLRLAMKRPVVYIAFGTQAEVSVLQLQEIATGLEMSGLDFLWVVRANEVDLGDDFEERVAGRGMVIREWVDQRELLQHRSVRGFLSQCGWNSVMNAVCAGVPILAWPMIAEQSLNAKLVVEELGIGLRVRASDGTRDGLVGAPDLVMMLRELLVGKKGKEAAVKVKELSARAKVAMKEGGSSWSALEFMILEVCGNTT